MTEERRAAPRIALPDAVEATVNDVVVRVLELSAVGARIEHDQRFPLQFPRLRLHWQGEAVALPIRVARSEIVARRDARLIYQTGIQFVDVDGETAAVIAAITRWAQVPAAGSAAPDASETETLAGSAIEVEAEAATPEPASPPSVPAPSVKPSPSSRLEDSWTREVQFLRSDVGDELPYAQFRLGDRGWVKEYVASPEQPDDGFTVPREESDLAELQRTFECADPETRRMMRIALESRLAQSVD